MKQICLLGLAEHFFMEFFLDYAFVGKISPKESAESKLLAEASMNGLIATTQAISMVTADN